MADPKVYIFENMSQADVNSFDASQDYLVFATTSVNAQNVVVTPSAADDPLSNPSITISANGASLTFLASALAEASQAGHVQFDDGSSLILGTAGADANATAVDGTAGNDVIYGFAGADSLSGAAGDDYIYGGVNADVANVAVADTLDGGAGNDHIYGNSITTTQGQVDGNDLLFGGDGNDYLQGNAGADTLNGDAGRDRLYGGAGNDILNGGDGSDSIQGNLGNDTIDGGHGNDIVRGGQGNDVIMGGDDVAATPGIPGNNGPDNLPNTADDVAAIPGTPAVTSNDILYGDLGDDTLDGGTGLDVLFGGAGNDVFRFAAGDSTFTTEANATNANVTDIIADYTDGQDKIDLGFTVAADHILVDTQGTTVTTLQAAVSYAQSLVNATAAANDTEVVALQVGSDTYLFTSSTAASGIDNAIKVVGVAPSVFGASDFVAH